MLVTLEQLSRDLDRDPGQLRRESKRPDFPVVKSGKKRRFDPAAVRVWLHHNVPVRAKRRKAVAQLASLPVVEVDDDGEPLIDFAAFVWVTIEWVESNDRWPNGLEVESLLGEKLYADLDAADIASLATTFNAVFLDLIRAEFPRKGVSIRSRASVREYFDEFYDVVGLERLDDALDAARWLWCARRFVDRPRWWKEIEVPLAALPPELQNVEPLPHRAKGK